ncbi:MAG: Stp1/IreP family PP2C-type Ser/Thr phosphatase [Bacteroidota bacterium]
MIFPFRKKQKARRESFDSAAKLAYRAVAVTDVGSVRESNEDNLVFIRPFDSNIRASHGCLAIVADGMGGHKSGEVASKMAVDIISRDYFDTDYHILEALKRAFDKANKSIFQKASRKASLKGMGTTCTAAVLLGDRIFLGHVGDSRAYLLKGDTLHQLTHDHTYVQHLIDTGEITHKESLTHPQRNVITQAMGTTPKLRADFILHELCLQEGDKLLLCSDGLYEYFRPDELGHLLRTRDLSDSAHEMIALSKQRGGHDNISVLLVETLQEDSNQSSKKTQEFS